MLSITPINLDEANAFVEKNHRHHKPVPGCKFAIAVSDEDGMVRGVVCSVRQGRCIYMAGRAVMEVAA